MNYELITTEKRPIKAWVQGVEWEPEAVAQTKQAANLDIVYPYLAVMPDTHSGRGSTVGSVIPTRKAIIPAAVGVDLGCGMMAVRTTLKASNLPDSLSKIRHSLERTIPVGFNDYKDHVPGSVDNAWSGLEARFAVIKSKHGQVVGANENKPRVQLATLGGGNHFIEVCLDENGNVWIMLHSGSRGIGNQIGRYFIEKAYQYTIGQGIQLTNRDLAWLDDNTELFQDYFEAMLWSQDYAKINRQVMMQRVLDDLRKQKELPTFQLVEQAINCHHNYAQKETHFGEELYITRKGAVSARTGELGIIPGSMGVKSFIVEGLGNVESFQSCSHGAGRRMSRTKAKANFSSTDLEAQTLGVECRKDKDVVDEIPAAYKDIDAVMNAQRDLVKVRHTLKQVLCIKG